MIDIGVGIVGLGNVGSGTLQILVENERQIREKLGFGLSIKAVCARDVANKKLPPLAGDVLRTADWREVLRHPEIDVVVEVVGGTGRPPN